MPRYIKRLAYGIKHIPDRPFMVFGGEGSGAAKRGINPRVDDKIEPCRKGEGLQYILVILSGE